MLKTDSGTSWWGCCCRDWGILTNDLAGCIAADIMLGLVGITGTIAYLTQ